MLSATPREIPHLAPSVLPRPPASSDPATTADVGREADHLSKAMDLNRALGRDTAVEALGLGVETVGLHVLEDVESRGQELPFMARLTERFGEVVDEKLQAQLAPLRAELAEQGRKISNNYARGTLTRPFRIVPDRMGRLPTNVGLRALHLVTDITNLTRQELDRYLHFYLGGQYHPPNPTGAPVSPEDVMRDKLEALGDVLGLSDAVIQRLRDSVEWKALVLVRNLLSN